jgi:geranyl-CoA carboxylase alpha subunit
VRIDHGLLEGQQVSPFYDPMLGKIIAYGATREEARRKLLRAVEDSALLGLQTNQRLLAGLLEHPRFIAGDFNTGFIAQHFTDHPSLHPHVPTTEELAVATALFYQQSAGVHTAGLAGWRNSASAPLLQQIGLGDGRWSTEVTALPDGQLRIQVAGETLQLKRFDINERWANLEINGIRRRYAYQLAAGQLWLFTRPGNLLLQDQTLLPVSGLAGTSTGTLKAPMDGAIVEVLVSEGSPVSKGQLLLVLEAMKMEHPLKAGIDGVIKRLQVSAGDQVKNRQILLEVE